MSTSTATNTIETLFSNSLFVKFLTPVLIGVIVSFLGTQLWNFLLEKKRKETERQEKLYGPLRFYLMVMKNNTTTREKLREDLRKNFKETHKNLDPKSAGESLIKYNQQFSTEIAGPAINEWWLHIDKVKCLLENFPGLIRKNDWPLIKDFISDLFLREMVVGKAKNKDLYNLFTDETTDNATKQILSSIEKLQNKLLD